MYIHKINLENIVNEIRNNPFITEKEISLKYFCHERTVRRYIKILRENKTLKISNNGIRKKWIIKDK